MDAEDDFLRLFGDCLSPAKEGEWAAVQSSLVVGKSVRGRVIDRRPFGVFLDIGVGFPALLEITQFGDARKRRYHFDDYPAIGATIVARVVRFDDRNRQIHLTELSPHPFLDGP